MDFNEWLRIERHRQGWSLQELAHSAGVDAATISRTERGQSQTSIITAVHLAEALHVTPAEMLRALQHDETMGNNDKPSSVVWAKREWSNIFRVGVLMLEDISDFVGFFSADSVRGQKFLAEWLNRLDQLDAQNRLDDQIGGEEVTVPFNLGDAIRLTAESPIIEVTLRHPVLRAVELLQIHKQGGVLAPQDVQNFVEQLAQYGTMTNDYWLRRLAKENIVSSGFFTERIKLVDVLRLDKDASRIKSPEAVIEEGDIITMFWNAITYQDALSNRPYPRDRATGSNLRQHHIKLASTFLKLCRWLQHTNRGNQWLWDLRRELSNDSVSW